MAMNPRVFMLKTGRTATGSINTLDSIVYGYFIGLGLRVETITLGEVAKDSDIDARLVNSVLSKLYIQEFMDNILYFKDEEPSSLVRQFDSFQELVEFLNEGTGISGGDLFDGVDRIADETDEVF
jgi:hypothetical protein